MKNDNNSEISRRTVLHAVAASTGSTTALSQTQRVVAQPTETPPLDSSPWPMKHGNPQGTSSVASEHAPTTRVLSEKWSSQVAGGDGLQPIVSKQGLVVATGRPMITATSLNLDTGQQQWKAQVDETTHASPVAEAENILFISEQGLASREGSSGKSASRTSVPRDAFLFVDLIATQGQILFASKTGVVGAIGPNSTGINWETRVDDSYRPAGIVVDDDTVYVAAIELNEDGSKRSGRVYALNASTGSTRWVRTIPSGAREIAVAAGTVVVGTVSRVHALKADSGDHHWDVKTATETPRFSITQDSVVIGGYRQLATVALSTGEPLWTTDFDSDRITPTIGGDTVYAAGSGDEGTNWKAQLKSISITDGSVNWSRSIDENRLHGPAIANGSLFISTDVGQVYAFNGGD